LGCFGLIKRRGFSLDKPPTSSSWVLYILELAPDVLIAFKMGKLREILLFKDMYTGSTSNVVIRCCVKGMKAEDEWIREVYYMEAHEFCSKSYKVFERLTLTSSALK
jgi:hypothetical protein